MAQIIVLFPGQGSQKNGMAQDFFREYSVSREVFECASEVLNLDMAALCFEEDPRLHLTAFTQPAIMTAEIAMYRALTTEFGVRGSYFGGHSLGEYTALVAAEAIPLEEALRLVHLRGRLMQQAVPDGVGAMAALNREAIDPEAVCRVLEGLDVDLANHNSPDQIVISGTKPAVENALKRLPQVPAGQGLQYRILQVSAPFHSRLMAGIEPEFRAALEVSLSLWRPEASVRVLSNTTGGLHDGNPAGLIDRLTRQISCPVRWVQNMETVVAMRPTKILEVGPRRTLRGFFRSMDQTAVSITNLVSARRATAD